MSAVVQLLKTVWGFDSFRPLQEEAMSCVLNGRDSLTVLPTGSGKSLCFQAPAILRIIVKFFRKRILNKPMKPGIKLPANMSIVLPDPETTWDDAVSALRSAMARIDAGERMTQPSPLLGAMSHEDWVDLNCRHAEMHFSFMHPA